MQIRRMLEIETSTGAANVRMRPAAQYGVRAGMYSDEGAATAALTAILEAGHDGALVTTENDGVLIFELRVGPFDSLDAAQTASSMLRGSFGLEPDVMVISEEPR